MYYTVLKTSLGAYVLNRFKTFLGAYVLYSSQDFSRCICTTQISRLLLVHMYYTDVSLQPFEIMS